MDQQLSSPGFGLHVVLVEPEIPQNTGSIGRLCLATGTTLHLVKPLGFEITHARLRRAGLDYWEHLKVIEHDSLDAYMQTLMAPQKPPIPFALMSKKATQTHFAAKYIRGMHLIFGKETKGLPEAMLDQYAKQSFKIPMYDDRVRSLNLSNAASIVVYEAIRQLESGTL